MNNYPIVLLRTKRNFLFALAFIVLSLTACDTGIGGIDESGLTKLDVIWPEELTAARGKRLSDISLASFTNGNTGTFSWASPSQSVGNNIGISKFMMVFTPSDTSRHSTVRSSVDVLVSMVDMQRIEAGSFTMGSPYGETGRSNNEDQWEVALSGFFIGRYEITQKQYETVMGESFLTTYKKANSSWASQDYGQGDNFPAYYISWYDALVFCNKLSMLEGLTPAYSIGGSTDPARWGAVPTSNNAVWNGVTVVANSTGYRIPTEAQWEYACRAGSTTAWSWGANESDYDNYAWTSLNSTITSKGYITNVETTGRKTREVGKKWPNAWGLYDMHGNVDEICWDWNDTYPNEARLNPTGSSSSPNNYRTSRGGYFSGTAVYGRSAYRGIGEPWYRGVRGLRVARPEGYIPQPEYNINLSAIAYSADGPELSRFMGYFWGGGFPWTFKNDGTIITTHCCGAGFPDYGYLLCGNILVTCYIGTSGGYAPYEVTWVSMADDGSYFTRNDGAKFVKFYRNSLPYTGYGSDPNAPIVVTNDLVGSWSGSDGSYQFRDDSRLMIGSDEYGYLVWNKNVLILGPLVDGGTAALKEYTYIMSGNTLSLIGKDAATATISLSRIGR